MYNYKHSEKKIRTILCLVVGTVLFINIYLIISSFTVRNNNNNILVFVSVLIESFYSFHISSLSPFLSCFSILILILIHILLSAFHTFFFWFWSNIEMKSYGFCTNVVFHTLV